MILKISVRIMLLPFKVYHVNEKVMSIDIGQISIFGYRPDSHVGFADASIEVRV